MKLIVLFILLNPSLAQSNNTDNTSLDDVNHKEQNFVLVIACSMIILIILLLVLYDRCCIYWNRVMNFRTDSNTNIVDLREI